MGNLTVMGMGASQIFSHPRMKVVIAVVSSCLAVLTMALSPPVASAGSVSVKSGKWRATVTFKRAKVNPYMSANTKLRVTVRKGRRVVVRKRPVSPMDRTWTYATERPTFRAANLDSDASPEFVLNWSIGCTHSCTQTNVFGVGPAKSRTVRVDMVDGFELLDLDANGVKEFVGRDSRFSYQFASYASSAPPVLVYSLASGTVADVTRAFPTVISADLDFLMQRWNESAQFSDGGAVALGIAANLCRLGRTEEAKSFLADAQELTTMNVPDELELGYFYGYSNEAWAFLTRLGYC